MKILKNKTYEKLNNMIEDYENLNSQQATIILNLNRDIELLSQYFNVRRAIVGKKQSGKTYFINKNILPQVNNYFVIGVFPEYKYAAKKDKLILTGLSLKDMTEKAIKAIDKHKNKLIILDDVGHYPITVIKHLLQVSRNYIIVFQSKQAFKPFISYFDMLYDFGTVDSIREKLGIIEIDRKPFKVK